MKLDFGSGRSPRAGSAALATEQSHRAAELSEAGSASIAAGTSARRVEESRTESFAVRTPELSFGSGARRERIFTPRPRKEVVAASAIELPGGTDGMQQITSPGGTEVEPEKELGGKHLGAAFASQFNSKAIPGSFSPLESVLRLFSRDKTPNTNPS